ncbi:MarR family winged helix-turn-helix transcriptional regulator [Agrobacterium rosae]|uniref:HTH-type transcriptional regulator MhqR n=3 Tax=Pseudomonadota TaxID=1224 RepID=A0A1R3TLG6_9HYPH|nr:MarR family winged helix-turn-helix transcriptional regulator [Agrobacterium rosae]MDX8313202.1 MarR family winged helix-turn-helix transcriptional regulator [Agrobacterium rosae]MDX8328055.1 MarR family winged helix-turn-helix transcriptional regulator [Agrobacterium rosae]SCX06849.1 HTH-type transcriptional regulator MhqR [Agrobacterium rosae]
MTIGLAFEHGRGKMTYVEADEAPLVSKGEIDYSILSEAVVYRLRRAQLSVVSEFNESLFEFGLRPADFSVLIVVANNTGLKQSDVAEALGIQRANFVAIIDGLEDKGLLQRRRSDSDRRVHYIEMTDEGRSVLEEISQIWKSHEAKLIDRLGGEKARDQLVGLLRRIQD